MAACSPARPLAESVASPPALGSTGRSSDQAAPLPPETASPYPYPDDPAPIGSPVAFPSHTAIAARPAEPAPVVLGRGEAVARVLAYFVPEQEARVLAVDYLSAVDFWALLNRWEATTAARYGKSLPLLTSLMALQNDASQADQVFCLVEVEAGPPRQLAPDLRYRPSWIDLEGDQSQRGDRRVARVYLLNASTGAELGSLDLVVRSALRHEADGPRPNGLLKAMREHPIMVRVEGTARPVDTAMSTSIRPSATASATTPSMDDRAAAGPIAAESKTLPGLPPDLCLPPDAQPVLLAPDALPAPLADALRWLPLLQGARWTYERTVAYNGAHWQRQTLTVTVAARWLLADDALLIHLASTVSGQRASLPHPWADVALGNLWSYGTDPAWLILLQDATFAVEHCADADRLTSLQERRAQLKAIVTAEASQNLQGLGVWHLLLGPRAQGDDTVAALWRLAAEPDLPSLVSLPAGALTSCRRYGNGDTHRFRSQGLLCPNLGWAAQMTSQGASAWARTITDILTAYHIPQGRPTP